MSFLEYDSAYWGDCYGEEVALAIEEHRAEIERLLASLEKARSTIRTEMAWNKAHEAENKRLRAALVYVLDSYDDQPIAEAETADMTCAYKKGRELLDRAARESAGEGE